MRKNIVVIIVALELMFALTSNQSPAQSTTPTFRSETNVVLVPSLVMKKSGDVVYGLSAKDFIVEDDGVEQTIRIDEAPEREPMSIVVAIQVGRSAQLHLRGHDKDAVPGEDSQDCRAKKRPCETTMGGLPTMLQSFIGESNGQIAVVTFDGNVKLLRDFTPDVDSLSQPLKSLMPGDGGAAILDAVGYSLELLDKRPKNERHVLLLISETRDHGSRKWNVERIVQRLMLGNTLVYSVAFSPARSEFMRDAKGENPAAGNTNLLAPIFLSVNGMRKNMARALAEMSGGEYQLFKNKQTFDRTLDSAAIHANNRYQLSFQPKSPNPGPHAIKVRLREPRKGVTLISRNSYWAVAWSR